MVQNIQKTLKRTILLNPGPATTGSEVKDSLLVSDICPREREFSEILKSIHKSLRAVIKASSDVLPILLPGSGTAALEAGLLLLKRAQYGKVLVLKNGAYGERIEEILLSHGISYSSLSFPNNEAIEVEHVEKQLKEEKYGAVCWVHIETSTGVQNPYQELITLAKKQGLLTFCDGMSSVGCVEINYQEEKCDFLVTSSNKGIGAFAGIGIIYTTTRMIDLARKTGRSGLYLDLVAHADAQFCEEAQCLYTPPVQIIYALKCSLDNLLKTNMSVRFAHLNKLQKIISNEMKKIGFSCYLDESYQSPVITTFLYPKGFSFDHYHDYLYKRGVTVYPGKLTNHSSFRIANLGDLDSDDLDLFFSLTKAYLLQESKQ